MPIEPGLPDVLLQIRRELDALKRRALPTAGSSLLQQTVDGLATTVADLATAQATLADQQATLAGQQTTLTNQQASLDAAVADLAQRTTYVTTAAPDIDLPANTTKDLTATVTFTLTSQRRVLIRFDAGINLAASDGAWSDVTTSFTVNGTPSANFTGDVGVQAPTGGSASVQGVALAESVLVLAAGTYTVVPQAYRFITAGKSGIGTIVNQSVLVQVLDPA